MPQKQQSQNFDHSQGVARRHPSPVPIKCGERQLGTAQATVRAGGYRSPRLFTLPRGLLVVPVPRRTYVRKGIVHLVVNRVIFGVPVNETNIEPNSVCMFLGVEENMAVIRLESGEIERWPAALESLPSEEDQEEEAGNGENTLGMRTEEPNKEIDAHQREKRGRR